MAKNYIKFIENQYWMFPIIAIVLGLFFPYVGQRLNGNIALLLIIVLFLTYLKIDPIQVLHHVKRPYLLIYLIFSFLLLIPVVVYFAFSFLDPTLRLSFLLLAAMPPGAASAALTDMVKGNTSLSLAISLFAYMICPLTIIFLFYMLTATSISINLLGVFKTLLIFTCGPFICSILVKRFAGTFYNRTFRYYSSINIFLISLINYVIISNKSQELIANPGKYFISVAWLYILFIILFLIGFFLLPPKSKNHDKLAVAVTKTYMNNALAVVLALSFFSPEVVVLAVLSEIPWSTTLVLFDFTYRMLVKRR